MFLAKKTRCMDLFRGNNPIVRNACPEIQSALIDAPVKESKLPIRVQSLDVPENGISLREMTDEEKAQISGLVRCGVLMWVVLATLGAAFVVVGFSEVALYGTGFSFILPAVFAVWLMASLRKEYWEAAAISALWRDSKQAKLAVIHAANDDFAAHLEILPNSLYLWTVDGLAAPWRHPRSAA